MRDAIYSLYFKLALKSKGKFFILLFNFQSFLFKKRMKIRFLHDENVFLVEEGSLSRRFVSERVATICYWKGLTHRGHFLAKSIFLDSVPISSNDIVVDCGANVGDLEIYFREKNINCKYLAFEPSPREYYCLKKNIEYGETFNLGLWEESKNLEFFISEQNSDSSFIEPPKFTSKINVPARRLDEIVEIGIKFLKVEAEGGEPEVLYGCQKILHLIEWIAVDVGFERGVSQENTLSEVSNFLITNGFSLEKFISPTGRWVALFKNSRISNEQKTL